MEIPGKGGSIKKINEKYIYSLLSGKSFKDEEHQLRAKLLRVFEDGVVARMRAKEINKELEKAGKYIGPAEKGAPQIAPDQTKIESIEKQIEDYNKPALTPKQLDDISEAIEEAVGSYHFDEVDDYDIELEMDYDGRVQASSINLNESYRLVERITEKVHNLFK